MTIRSVSRTRNPFRYYHSLFLLGFLLAIFISLLTPGAAYPAEATLAWEPNTESDVKGYKIYYGTASRDYNLFIDVGNTTTWTVADLNEGTTYYFAATAYNDSQPAAESTYSDEVSKTFCSYAISPASQSFTASGGTGTVNVTTQTGCTWTSSSGTDWLTITSMTSETVNYSVSQNTTTSSRSAVITIAGRVFTVTQQGASSTPSSTTYTITASAGTGGSISPAGAVQVAQGADRSFTITPSTGYAIADVTVDGSSVGAAGAYTFHDVAANHTIVATFTNTACTYSVSPTNATLPASESTGTLTVTTQSGCSWTASSSAPWLTITSGSNGSGSGTVRGLIAANTSTSSRTATITIAGSTVTVTQLGSSNVSSNTTYTITASAGTGGSISPAGSIAVSSGSNHTLTISPNTGYRIYQLLVDGNSVGAVSSYTFNNVTANHTIRATFAGCTYSVSPTNATLPASESTGTLTVTTQSGCSWTASSSAPWLTITSGSNGSGSGTVRGLIAANTSTSSRTATITIAGSTVTVTQLGN
jgi:hypothetical protein